MRHALRVGMILFHVHCILYCVRLHFFCVKSFTSFPIGLTQKFGTFFQDKNDVNIMVQNQAIEIQIVRSDLFCYPAALAVVSKSLRLAYVRFFLFVF